VKLLSVNVGVPRDAVWRGEVVRTGIFKSPVSGRIAMHGHNLDGDAQADLSVHGGADKAVYGYPSEHYGFWCEWLGVDALPWGAFGENLTTEGLREDALCIGDHLSIGSAEFLVTQPRLPCFKLGVRFQRPDMVQLFQRSGRNGFYLSVLREGAISAGEPIRVTAVGDPRVTVGEIARLYTDDEDEQELLRRASGLAALPEDWREYFRHRLWKPDA